MLRMLSLTFATGALLVAASTANAAGECRGGYRELGNGVIVSCNDDYGYEAPPVYVAPPVVVAPQVYIGRPYYYDDYYDYYGDNYYDYGRRPYYNDRRHDARPKQRDGYYSKGPCGGFGQPACRN
jgi:hypothetical protein